MNSVEMAREGADAHYAALNEFLLCERGLEQRGKTCYLTAVLMALNASRRFVLSYLMSDPLPAPEGAFSHTLREWLADYRKSDEEPESYEALLEALAKTKPMRQYSDEEQMGDSLEALHDIFTQCIADESEVIRRRHRRAQRAAGILRQNRPVLADVECL